ncbi:contractile injection system tape measure protein [Thalassotalea atypica]|uniref:contractile injection system tape measure protein n=1 Tax=Thalassotalea atypica TaxID=2054316 RepID=UPI0025726540|nr:contractile injection system tape measure protein [Thalassotalea atypica]
MNNNIVIDQAALEVTFQNHTQATSYEHELTAICQDSLLPIIERKLSSALSLKSQTIDYLELNLGTLNSANLQNEMTFRLAFELERILGEVNSNKSKNEQDLVKLCTKKEKLQDSEKCQLISWLLNVASFSDKELAAHYQDIYNLLKKVIELQPRIIAIVLREHVDSIENVKRLVSLIDHEQLTKIFKELCKKLSTEKIHFLQEIFSKTIENRELTTAQKYHTEQLLASLICFSAQSNFSGFDAYNIKHIIRKLGLKLEFNTISDDTLSSIFTEPSHCRRVNQAIVYENNEGCSLLSGFSRALKTNDRDACRKYLELLLLNSPLALVEFIRCYQNKQLIIKTLCHHLLDKQLINVITHYDKEHTELVDWLPFFTLSISLETLPLSSMKISRQESKSIASIIAKEAWRHLFWSITLEYLFVQKRHLNTQQAFLCYLLYNLANNNGLKPTSLLEYFRFSIRSLSGANSLKCLLDSLFITLESDYESESVKQKYINDIDQQIVHHQDIELLIESTYKLKNNREQQLNRIVISLLNGSSFTKLMLFQALKAQVIKGIGIDVQLSNKTLSELLKTSLMTLSHWSQENSNQLLNSINRIAVNEHEKSKYYLLSLEKNLLNEAIDIRLLSQYVQKNVLNSGLDQTNSLSATSHYDAEPVERNEIVNYLTEFLEPNNALAIAMKSSERAKLFHNDMVMGALEQCPDFLRKKVEHALHNETSFYSFIQHLKESLLIRLAMLLNSNRFVDIYRRYKWLYMATYNSVYSGGNFNLLKWNHLFLQLQADVHFDNGVDGVDSWVKQVANKVDKPRRLTKNIIMKKLSYYIDEKYLDDKNVLDFFRTDTTNQLVNSAREIDFEKKLSPKLSSNHSEYNYFESILFTLFTRKNANISMSAYIRVLEASADIVRQYFTQYVGNTQHRNCFISNISNNALQQTCSILFNEKYDGLLCKLFDELSLNTYCGGLQGTKSVDRIIWSCLLSYFHNQGTEDFVLEQCIDYLSTEFQRNNIYLTEPGVCLDDNANVRNRYCAMWEKVRNRQASSGDSEDTTALMAKREKLSQIKNQFLILPISAELLSSIGQMCKQCAMEALAFYNWLVNCQLSKKNLNALSVNQLNELIKNYLNLIIQDKQTCADYMIQLATYITKHSYEKQALIYSLIQLVTTKFIDFSSIEIQNRINDYQENKNIPSDETYKKLTLEKHSPELAKLPALSAALKAGNAQKIVFEIQQYIETHANHYELIDFLTNDNVFMQLTNCVSESDLLIILSYFNVKSLGKTLELTTILQMLLSRRNIGVTQAEINLHQWKVIFDYFLIQGLSFNLAWFIHQYFHSYILKYKNVSTQLSSELELLISELSFYQLGFAEISFKKTVEGLVKTLSGNISNERGQAPLVATDTHQQDNVRDDAFKHDKPQIAYINNAGLVLLSPYLPRLFSIMELTQHGKFRDQYHQTKAVNVLQHIIAPEREFHEHQLALNKLMCGMELSQSVKPDPTLSDKQKEVINDLLSEVIKQWPALGNTSINGLRQTFLAREGALYREENNWHLDVLPEPFDILLDGLPWTYSTFKYSWMTGLLSTTWRDS